MIPEAIMVPCEGTDCPTHDAWGGYGICSMCGSRVWLMKDTNIAGEHSRRDILAMIERGDFDE